MDWKADFQRKADEACAQRGQGPDAYKENWGYAAMLLGRAGRRDLELANRVMEGASAADPRTASGFDGGTLGHALLKYGPRLGGAAKDAVKCFLNRWAAECRGLWTTTRGEFGQFANVNINLSGWCGIFLTGMAHGDGLLCRVSLGEIGRLLTWIDWQHDVERGMGTYAEFNCPAYTGTDIMALARAADVCPPGPMKNRLLDIEGRFWLDAALFYHKPTNLLSGPHARAYQNGCVGHRACMDWLFAVAAEGGNFVDTGEDGPAHPEALAINFHMPPRARRIAFEKRFPFYVQVNGFCGGWNYGQYVECPGTVKNSYPFTEGMRYAEHGENHPARYTDIRSYQTAEFSLGTCSLPYREGVQNNAFMLRWRRAQAIRRMGDTRSVYARYITNDKRQGETNRYERQNFEWGPFLLAEEGRPACLQHENKAIVLFRPREVENRGKGSLKLNLLMTRFAGLGELVVGRTPVGSLPFDFDWRQTLYIRDGGVYVAFKFLDPADFGRKTPCRIAEERDHLAVSVFNYEGPRRDFAREDMFRMHNGFVCEVRGADEFRSLEAFMAHMEGAAVSERRDGPHREVTYKSGSDVLEAAFDAEKECFLRRAVNGSFSLPERMRVLMGGEEDPDFCPRRIW